MPMFRADVGAADAESLAVDFVHARCRVVHRSRQYSEMYYPKARFVDNVEDQELIARAVPFGRLGRPEEAGALIVSGKRRSRRCPRENRKVTESAGRIKERNFSFSPSGRF